MEGMTGMTMLETICRGCVVQPTLSILIAEDSDMLRETFRKLLLVSGFEADVVCNGREAVEAAAVRDYDVIFLDVQMPQMDGLEAAARLREGRRRVRPWIVGLSGEAEHRRGYAAGMDEFLVKPVRLTNLIQILMQFDCAEKRLVGWSHDVASPLQS
jgi:CheY-like chemotaxis protein